MKFVINFNFSYIRRFHDSLKTGDNINNKNKVINPGEQIGALYNKINEYKNNYNIDKLILSK